MLRKKIPASEWSTWHMADFDTNIEIPGQAKNNDREPYNMSDSKENFEVLKSAPRDRNILSVARDGFTATIRFAGAGAWEMLADDGHWRPLSRDPVAWIELPDKAIFQNAPRIS